MFKAALFDVDGVILDSEEIYCRAVQETFSKYGIDINKDEYVRRYMIEQTTTEGVIMDYKLDVSLKDARARKSEIVKRLTEKELEMMPFAIDMLRNLQGRYALGVVSSASSDELSLKLGKFGLQDMFKVKVTADDVRKTKPHPEPYKKGVELLGLEPRNVVAVEDNPSGVRSAKGAGCIVIAFPNGFTQGMDFSEADTSVSSLLEIDDNMLRSLFYSSSNPR